MANPQACAGIRTPVAEVSPSWRVSAWTRRAPASCRFRFALINHSDADLGDISLLVNVARHHGPLQRPAACSRSRPPCRGWGPAMSRM